MNTWPQEYADYGVIKTSSRQLRIYKDIWNYIVVNTEKDVESAIWAGRSLIIHFRDGSTRRYLNNFTYERVG